MSVNIEKKIRRLRRKIEKYNKQYYNQSESSISDSEYDSLVKKLERLESKYPEYSDESSPTKKVSSDRDPFFKKVKHKYKMYSLDNAYTESELVSFFKKLPDITFSLEDKVDGLSLELQYVKGKLEKAITRGDGEYGDDVTENVIQGIKNIPHYLDLNPTCSVKGEVVIYKDTFNNINHNRKSMGLKPYANARNLSSGTLKLHDPKEVSERGLKFIAWDVESPIKYKVGQKSQIDKLKWFVKSGFSIPNWDYTKSKEIMKVLGYFENKRAKLDYEVDGVVIKLNDWSQRVEAGFGTKSPKWAIAYKFSSEIGVTTLEGIEFNVGRSGKVTPIANLKPIYLAGSTIKKATLHNSDFITERGLSIGCEVKITKGGDIIPKVLEVVSNHNSEPFEFPTNCPICDSILYKEDGVDWYCPNTFGKCTKFKEKLYHFVSKEALDIQGLGEGVINKFIEEGLLHNFIDFFIITQSQIEKIEGMGPKSASYIIKSIDEAFNKPMDKWLFALGIPGIGSVNAKVLCSHFVTWNKLMKAQYSDFLNIPGFGGVLIKNVTDWTDNVINQRLVKNLKRLGMPRRYIKENLVKENILNGKIICITGTFDNFKRDYLSKRIEELGGVFTNSLNSKTNILMVGSNVGKNKLEKASKHDIEILSTDESLKLLKL